jgi:hypothetical protein
VDGDGSHVVAFTATDVAGNQERSRALPHRHRGARGRRPRRRGPAGHRHPKWRRANRTVPVRVAVDEPTTVTAVIGGRGRRPQADDGVEDTDGVLTWDGRTAAGTAVPDGAISSR